MTEHHFEIEDAKKYWIEKAILLYNFRFWLNKEFVNSYKWFKKAKIKEHENGKKYVWTFNSSNAFSELFPYMPERNIRRYLQELEKDGIIFSNNFNQHKYDKTKWYTMPEFELKKPSDESSDGSDEMSNASDESSDPMTQIVRPIPDINTDINTDNKHYNTCTKVQEEKVFPDSLPLPILPEVNGSDKGSIKSPPQKCGIPPEKINGILAIFNSYNKAIGYAHKGHRRAIEGLLSDYTYEEVADMVKWAYKVHGEDYAPVITTPHELALKLPKLKLFIEKKFNEKSF